MRLPLAATHLARVAQLTGATSFARSLDEGRLALASTSADDTTVLARLKTLAREEKALNAEAQGLLTARKWPALGEQPYAWSHLKGAHARGALPRIARIYERDMFELEGLVRECQDEEVCSVVLATLDARRSVHAFLVALAPQESVPGGK